MFLIIFTVPLSQIQSVSGYSKLKIVKGKTPCLDNDVIIKCPKIYHLNTRIKLGNSDFRNQRTRVSKKSYVAKNQRKMPLGVSLV